MSRIASASPNAWSQPRRALPLLALWLLATLGLRPLLVPDEGRYATVARDMLLQGDGLVPLLNGLPFFHKPPLMYWLDMAAMALVGVNAFSARIAPFAGAFAMGAAVLLAARRWHGERAGAAALLVLATMPFFYVGGQYANLDMLVGGMIAATVLAFVRAAEAPSLCWVLGAWALAALSVLAKGLIGLVLPALVVGPWLLAQRRWRDLLRLLHPLGLAVFAALALPWFVLMQQRYPGFFDYFVMEQHFRRFVQTNFNNAHRGWFYLAVLPALTLPWSAWLPAALADAWRERAPAERAQLALYGWWIVAVVGFFSLPTSKLVGYVLPALAPCALLIGLALARRPRALRWTLAIGASVCLGAVAVLALKSPHSSRPAALVLGAQIKPGDRVVFVDEMFYDLPFYAGLREPVIVASDWADPDLARRDNWRKELFDAARFDPPRAKQLLWPLARIGELACHPQAVWFVVRPGNESRLSGLGLEKVHADREVVLWRSAPRPC
ncbi:MAG TPA: glycosyltransferase family 39 protein [Albitalea sp.]|uniref:glycosyltransferase family 39 protein n=1 Tax=Piscinibacter sp. TaxID=1903157 RepID=UPI002ED371D0